MTPVTSTAPFERRACLLGSMREVVRGQRWVVDEPRVLLDEPAKLTRGLVPEVIVLDATGWAELRGVERRIALANLCGVQGLVCEFLVRP